MGLEADIRGFIQHGCKDGARSRDLYVYTDSKCGIDLIRRIINAPWSVTECKHFPLLQAIADALDARAASGFHTYIYKVTSHSGIQGNDEADAEAKKAALRILKPTADEILPHSVKTVSEPTTSEAYPHFWLTHRSPSTANVDGSTHIHPAKIIPNLSEASRRLPAPFHSGGQFHNRGTYAQAWSTAAHLLEASLSNAFLTQSKGTYRQRALAFKARWGMLYTRVLAHRYKAVPTPKCPRCNHPHDSVTHLLSGECRATEGLTTLRHDNAVKLILKFIKGGHLGSSFTIMDAGKAADLPLQGVAGKKVPHWLLPSVPEATRKLMRPDILIIAARNVDPLSPPSFLHEDIHLIEVGYGSDLSLAAKVVEKQTQHAELLKALQTEGYKRVHFHVIPLGHSGSIPRSLIPTLMALKIERPKAIECCKKLHMHAIRHIETLYEARMHFERTHGLFSSHQGCHESRDANFQQNDVQQEHREHSITRQLARQDTSPGPKSQPSDLNQLYRSLPVSHNHGITSKPKNNKLTQDINQSVRGKGGEAVGIAVKMLPQDPRPSAQKTHLVSHFNPKGTTAHRDTQAHLAGPRKKGAKD